MLMGGVARGRWALQDVWHSADAGVTWHCSIAAAPWSARSGHAAITWNGQVLLLGGVGRRGLCGDVWKCADGIGTEWTEAQLLRWIWGTLLLVFFWDSLVEVETLSDFLAQRGLQLRAMASTLWPLFSVAGFRRGSIDPAGRCGAGSIPKRRLAQ